MAAGHIDDVSRETLAAFHDLLCHWNRRINLVGRHEVDRLWDRHLEDAVRIAQSLEQPSGPWVDLGSGGGIPGIVIAVLQPQIDVILVESDARKVAFLRTARRELGLTFEVHHGRIEEIPPLLAGTISARALAPLPKLLSYCGRHARPDATFVLPKGQSWRQELDEARSSWDFDLSVEGPSVSPILLFSNVRLRLEDHADH